MAQVLEITKHSDKYLIHHFSFECNDSKMFGNFAGNWTLNKFMSLHDWHQIFNSLNDSIQQYIGNPTKRPAPMRQRIDDTNFHLNIAWIKMNANVYSNLFTTIDFDLVFAYVIKVMVSLQSNIDKFSSAVDVTEELPIATASNSHHKQQPPQQSSIKSTTNRKRTPKRNDSAKSQLPLSKMTNGIAHKPVQLKECCVRLPLLQFDENGQVIQQQTKIVRNNKRKYSSIANNPLKRHSIKITPIRKGQGAVATAAVADTSIKFKIKCASTPFIRNTIDATDNNGSESVKQRRRIPTQRMSTSTPLSSQARRTGSTQFNPRIRLLKMPENVSKLNMSAKKSKHKIRTADKKSTKVNGKMKRNASTKRIIKKKVRSIPNESELFETPPKQNRKEKKATADASAITTPVTAAISTTTPPLIIVATPDTPDKVNNDSKIMLGTPCNSDIVKLEYLDLKSMTKSELLNSFDDHFEMISNLFVDYLKQTDEAVKLAGDYDPFSVIIPTLTTDQFSIMLDICFEKLVKIGESGDIQYENLFYKSIIPEWILAIIMQQNSFDRKTAIEKIASQKSHQNQEQYTSLINIRLDDTANSSKM